MPPRDPRNAALALVLLVTLAGLFAFRGAETHESTGRTVGFGTEPEVVGGLLVTEVQPGSPAADAGLLAGDLVVAVGGHRVRDDASYDARAMEFQRGEPVLFTVRRQGREVDLTVRPGIPFPWRRLLGDVLIALAYAAMAVVSLRYFHDVRARLLFLFSFAVAIEFAIPGYVVGRPLLNAAFFIVFYVVSGFQLGLELHLASVIPEPRSWLVRHRWVVPSYYAVGALVAVVGSLGLLAAELGWSWLPWTAFHSDLLINDVLLPLWAVAVALILLPPALRHPVRQARHQAGLVLAGVVPWTAIVLISAAHDLLAADRPAWIETVWWLALLIYPVAIFVAIFQFQLFDMELVVRRSLVYSALSLVLLLVFYASLGAGAVVFSEILEGSRESTWAVALATLVLGLLFTPLRRALEGVIYRRFFPERVALRQRLASLAGDLASAGKLPLMGQRLVSRLCDDLDVQWATVLLADPSSGVLAKLASTRREEDSLEHSLLLSSDDPGLRLLTASGRPFPASQLAARSSTLAAQLRVLEAELVVPMIHQDRLVGLLVLGPKEGGEKYMGEESELLGFLGQHVAVVFENARLFESATRDSLTGLLRREAILEHLDRELDRARRYGRPLTVGLADLDHFKRVNDEHGHLTGDAMLKWIAQVLADHLRNTDHIGRYGGEEFLLVLPETDLPGGVRVAEKTRDAVAARRLFTAEGAELATTVSLGLASLQDLPTGATARDLLAAADASLYRAKQAGRNQVRPTVA